MLPHQNFIILIASPSGAGKTTLINMLLEKDKKLKMSVSATSRRKRVGEVDGVHYFFYTKEEFEQRIKNNEFVEYAEVFGHLYGTPKKTLNDTLKSGYDVIADIDWQGVRQISEKLEKRKLLKIFILPPSIKVLSERLHIRGQDSESVIQRRMEQAKSEISHYKEFDYVIVNDNLNVAFAELWAVINAKRIENVKGLDGFVEDKLR